MITTEEIEDISFRRKIDEIPATTYATHSIHYYPAAFIPQVIRYCIDKFTLPNDWILDPFAGSGSVGVESFITNRKAMLVDINPIIKWLMEAKLLIPNENAKNELKHEINECLKYDGKIFRPNWQNLDYFYPVAVSDFLCKLWGYLTFKCNSQLKPLLQFALLDVSKRLSYADDQVPKLFKSKRKIEKLDNLLTTDWKYASINQFKRKANDYLEASFELKSYLQQFNCDCKRSSIEIYAPQDIESWNCPRDYKLMVTSPPYLQAQEYIRSSKMDLFWLGSNDKETKKLTKLEIPYRLPKELVTTPTLQLFRQKIEETKRTDLLRLYDSYFSFTLRNFERLARNLAADGRLCIFVGSATVAGFKVPIWQIIGEYLEKYNLAVEKVFEDKIVARKLFGYRKNLNPNGIISEHLVILKRG